MSGGRGVEVGPESSLSGFACAQDPETGGGGVRAGGAVPCSLAPRSVSRGDLPGLSPSGCNDAAVVGGGSCIACSHSSQVARQSFLFIFRWCQKSSKPF